VKFTILTAQRISPDVFLSLNLSLNLNLYSILGDKLMKIRTLLFILIPIVLLAQSLPAAFAQENENAARASASLKSGNEYKIGSGDVLDIMTWKEPELTRNDILVRIDGKISFPLIGDVQASGLDPVELKKQIESGLSTYVSNPVVTVSVRTPGSKKFYILGEVTRAGEYVLLKNLTVLQAFALAGGFTEWASKKEIILLRSEEGKEKIFRINYKSIVKGKDLEQNLKIRTDDTIIVP